MEATLTSKGQLTLPKPARDELKLVPGSTFTVRINEAGEIVLKPIRCNPLSVAGLLKRPDEPPLKLEDIDRLIGEHLGEMDDRIRTTGRSGLSDDA